ncbi:polysaccharide pyruvyl transferase family protein [Saccharicrinis aurantiacus]|uniref:polysaccharide pyruvyl transferase family protein n=1 Tax=Saccharicrinis aurantiacus TaxID=1849719 RepID=UPI00094F8AF0|nr:polysaccharide pyruvyl transferase family protein [Saccharicrinis aurantiacus]
MNYLSKIPNKLKSIYQKLKPFPTIVKYTPNGTKKMFHISAFTYGNAGDIVLPIVLRDLFNIGVGVKLWKGQHVYKIVSQTDVDNINRHDAMVIGGGGLFLKDTNPNDLSGWQWSCSIDELKQMNVPIIMFAVGYNRFRGQSEFKPLFKQHLNAFVGQAKFIGIRNTGSINKLKDYLETDELKNKLTFQPCMTTLISKIYPDLHNYKKKEDFIAINCAFDRVELRKGTDLILNSIARVAKELSNITRIKYYSHMLSDNKILPYFNKYKVQYELIEMKTEKQVLEEYIKPRLVIGMRGHAQMIPFGCLTPILSIVSHNKLQWFLDDISHPDWGVDVLSPNFEKELLEKSVEIYTQYTHNMIEVEIAQEKLWQITKANLKEIKSLLDN